MRTWGSCRYLLVAGAVLLPCLAGCGDDSSGSQPQAVDAGPARPVDSSASTIKPAPKTAGSTSSPASTSASGAAAGSGPTTTTSSGTVTGPGTATGPGTTTEVQPTMDSDSNNAGAAPDAGQNGGSSGPTSEPATSSATTISSTTTSTSAPPDDCKGRLACLSTVPGLRDAIPWETPEGLGCGSPDAALHVRPRTPTPGDRFVVCPPTGFTFTLETRYMLKHRNGPVVDEIVHSSPNGRRLGPQIRALPPRYPPGDYDVTAVQQGQSETSATFEIIRATEPKILADSSDASDGYVVIWLAGHPSDAAVSVNIYRYVAQDDKCYFHNTNVVLTDGEGVASLPIFTAGAKSGSYLAMSASKEMQPLVEECDHVDFSVA
jgi:hypothetical protein